MSTEGWEVADISIGPGELFRGRFEYRIESRPRNPKDPPTREDLVRWLNGLGVSGWRLCAVYEDAYGTSEFFFARELV